MNAIRRVAGLQARQPWISDYEDSTRRRPKAAAAFLVTSVASPAPAPGPWIPHGLRISGTNVPKRVFPSSSSSGAGFERKRPGGCLRVEPGTKCLRRLVWRIKGYARHCPGISNSLIRQTVFAKLIKANDGKIRPTVSVGSGERKIQTPSGEFTLAVISAIFPLP